MAKFLQRLALVAVLVGGATALAASTANAGPERPGTRRSRARRTFNLFAGATDLSLEVNRVYCGLTDAGNVCTDVTGSPVLGGGSWPRGTPDQYIFNTGVQLAGVIPANAGFAWAGDTVGAWAIDTRGPAEHMQTVTGLYNSLNSADMAAGVWPSAAFVNDTSLYHSSLIGRQSISQQDTWVRYWDGAPNLVTGRGHTMGVLVEQRSLAWNFPTGKRRHHLLHFPLHQHHGTGLVRGLPGPGEHRLHRPGHRRRRRAGRPVPEPVRGGLQRPDPGRRLHHRQRVRRLHGRHGRR